VSDKVQKFPKKGRTNENSGSDKEAENPVASMEEKKNAYRILIWNPHARRQLRRPCNRWEDNIKWTLKK
jgi:hypothetical protein